MPLFYFLSLSISHQHSYIHILPAVAQVFFHTNCMSCKLISAMFATNTSDLVATFILNNVILAPDIRALSSHCSRSKLIMSRTTFSTMSFIIKDHWMITKRVWIDFCHNSYSSITYFTDHIKRCTCNKHKSRKAMHLHFHPHPSCCWILFGLVFLSFLPPCSFLAYPSPLS